MCVSQTTQVNWIGSKGAVLDCLKSNCGVSRDETMSSSGFDIHTLLNSQSQQTSFQSLRLQTASNQPHVPRNGVVYDFILHSATTPETFGIKRCSFPSTFIPICISST